MIKARVIDDAEMWRLDRVRIVVWETDGFDSRRFLQADGTWWTEALDEGTAPDPTRVGFVVPAEALEALAVAIQERQGHTSHADTEARVLREWLAVEQRRVDTLIEREAT